MTAGRAAIIEAPGRIVVADVEYADPGPGEVFVRLTATGLCHTDLGVLAGGIPVSPGDAVLLSLTSCGACDSCVSAHPACCDTWLPRNLLGGIRPEGSAGVTRGGEPVAAHFFGQSSFGTYAIADERSLVAVADDADLTVLAPLGCGVLTGFGSMWNVLDPGPADVVAVYGAGAVGLSAIMAAAMREPARIIVIDRVAARLDLAHELGATDTVDASSEDVAARLAALTGGPGDPQRQGPARRDDGRHGAPRSHPPARRSPRRRAPAAGEAREALRPRRLRERHR